MTCFPSTGVARTPYSKEGHQLKAAHIGRFMPLERARHRHRLARALGRVGCRVPETAAIIRLPGLETTMRDESKMPAALMVRGFRSVLRVKQLDPIANLLLSDRHRPAVEGLLRQANQTAPN